MSPARATSPDNLYRLPLARGSAPRARPRHSRDARFRALAPPMVACGCARGPRHSSCAAPRPRPGPRRRRPAGRPPSRRRGGSTRCRGPARGARGGSRRRRPLSPRNPPPGATRPPPASSPRSTTPRSWRASPDSRARAPDQGGGGGVPTPSRSSSASAGWKAKRALHVSWHPDAARAASASPRAVHKEREPLLRRAVPGQPPRAHPRRRRARDAVGRVAILTTARGTTRPPPRFPTPRRPQGRNSNAVLAEADPERPTIVACAYQLGRRATMRGGSHRGSSTGPPVATGVAARDPTVAEEARMAPRCPPSRRRRRRSGDPRRAKRRTDADTKKKNPREYEVFEETFEEDSYY